MTFMGTAFGQSSLGDKKKKKNFKNLIFELLLEVFVSRVRFWSFSIFVVVTLELEIQIALASANPEDPILHSLFISAYSYVIKTRMKYPHDKKSCYFIHWTFNNEF